MKRTRILSMILSVCMAVMCIVGFTVTASADYLTVTEMDNSDLEGVDSVAALADKLGIATIGEYSVVNQTIVPSDEKLYFIYGIDAQEDQVLGLVFEYGVLVEGFGANLTVLGLEAYMDDGYTVCYVAESDFNAYDLTNAFVDVNTYDSEVTVILGDKTVPESEYHVIFFAREEIEGGESLERVGNDFPTESGTYIAAVVANEGSEYTGENRSEPFTVEIDSSEEENDTPTGDYSEHDLSNSIVYVTVESKNVTVRLGGGLVSEENYHVIFFAREEIEGGESLTRVGTDFPTEQGTYIAAIVANDDSGFIGENRSEPFTIEAAAETNPRTGAELSGLALLAISAAAVAFAAKRRFK